jgi:hypothetical protein
MQNLMVISNPFKKLKKINHTKKLFKLLEKKDFYTVISECKVFVLKLSVSGFLFFDLKSAFNSACFDTVPR